MVDMFARWSIAYSKVLMCHLREDGDVQKTMEVGTATTKPFGTSKLVTIWRLPGFLVVFYQVDICMFCTYQVMPVCAYVYEELAHSLDLVQIFLAYCLQY